MMQVINNRYEYDNLMGDILIYDGKNMDLAGWLLQREKVALLTNSKEHELATAISTSTSYKMLQTMGRARRWHEIRKKLEVLYLFIATDIHGVNDLHRKQCPDGTLQEYIQNFTDLTNKAMGINPANIKNRAIIFLFIKNLYNKDIRRRVAGAKVINTLADAFRLAHHSLLRLKKYEGLVFNEEQEIGEINQIVDLSNGIGQTGNIKNSSKK